MDATGAGDVSAHCPPDHPYVLGGGAAVLQQGITGLDISAPEQPSGPESVGLGGWHALAVNGGGVQVFAICAK